MKCEVIACAWCGNAFKQKHSTTRCCSKKCGSLDRDRRERAAREAGTLAVPKVTCVECGKKFTPKMKRVALRVSRCSNRCVMRMRRKAAGLVPITECEVCGKPKPPGSRADAATCGAAKCKRITNTTQKRLRRCGAQAFKMDFDNIMRSWLRRKKKAEESGKEFSEPRPERRPDEVALPESWRERHEFDVEDD